jgi:methyltransferase (TIGR00027 family)
LEALRPSRTAQGAAMHRAAHQLLDRPRVFTDPMAFPIIGSEAEAEIRAGRWQGLDAQVLRAFIVARSRLTEDILAEALVAGTKQYVILGAGLDTFACRHAAAPPIVYEVDHPPTQAWKRARLSDAGIAVPPHAVFVSLDFERETLEPALARAGFDFAMPALVAWLGVTPYLSRDSIRATLGFAASRLARGSGIVLDYAEPPDSRDPLNAARFAALSERVARAGEPFRSFFDPTWITSELRELGFSQIQDFDAGALNARYFGGRADGLRVAGRGHCLHARL